RAIAMSVYVIRAFIEVREKVAANAAILKRLAEIDKTLLEHDTVANCDQFSRCSTVAGIADPGCNLILPCLAALTRSRRCAAVTGHQVFGAAGNNQFLSGGTQRREGE